MSDVPPLHTIEAIVTPDRFEYGVARIRLPGGFGYWLTPAAGAVVTFFVPDQAEPADRPPESAVMTEAAQITADLREPNGAA